MDKLWKLVNAIFWIAAGLGLLAIGWIFSGGMFREAVTVLMAYAAMGMIMLGIVKGFFAIADYNKEHKEKE